eukprot:CAMPEP_0173441764 /NCGR_PEP_ID=MMETSP1357-20121228/24124_1 /TAXON_ID=77926 /ORGANISM="Hemiselmis rufescens, Strain PCC563" /LENGTH=578 /DNA_ID=CAMNT_0014407363 /DNA_START=82 /DNA_END=1815 /DNA_ORIENTATION=-
MKGCCAMPSHKAMRYAGRAAAAVVIIGVSLLLLEMHQAAKYPALTASNEFDIDAYVTRGLGRGFENPPISEFDKAKVVTLHSLSVLGHTKRETPIPLSYSPSPFVPSLHVSAKAKEGGGTGAALDKPLIVGTIRMGFGHHRIAYATASWGIESGAETLFHDLLAVESPEADLIKRTDELYSKGSRLASEIGGLIESTWGGFTSKSGDANALRTAYQLSEVIKPLLQGLDTNQPIIATHSLVGLTAVAAGFKNVINLVIDNHPQWFLVVPGALNLVQGPKTMGKLLRMGVPESDVRLAGHWVPSDLVNNAEADSATRLERVKRGAPLRIMLPVGGAGAQRRWVTSLIEALGPLIKKGDVQLLINAGDHKHMRGAFEKVLTDMAMKPDEDYEVVTTMDGVRRFCDERRNATEPPRGVTLFAFESYFPAVAATDLLSRVSDVLACKPSELAFYPLPKLMLRRVGDHEADSALRANELGEGTEEIREVSEAVSWIRLMLTRPAYLRNMNKRVIANVRTGVYDGCKNAVQTALEMQQGTFRRAPGWGAPARISSSDGECTVSYDVQEKYDTLAEMEGAGEHRE